MEKAKNVYTMSAEFGWSDLGTWKSLYEHLQHDKNENAVVDRMSCSTIQKLHCQYSRQQAGCHHGP
jgi:mannose-1-phosphate guanylyltransferase